MIKSIMTGSVLSGFSEPVKTEYSRFAALPRELSNFLDQLAKVEYPVNSKSEFLEKLGGEEAPIFIGENVVNAAEALMFLPATFFPIADPANLAEKMSDYFAQRALVQRRRDLKPTEIQDLARRFATESPELFTAAARAVQSLNAMKLEKFPDDDMVAAAFVRDNERLVEEVANAVRGAGRLRAKAREDLQEKGRRS